MKEGVILSQMTKYYAIVDIETGEYLDEMFAKTCDIKKCKLYDTATEAKKEITYEDILKVISIKITYERI